MLPKSVIVSLKTCPILFAGQPHQISADISNISYNSLYVGKIIYYKIKKSIEIKMKSPEKKHASVDRFLVRCGPPGKIIQVIAVDEGFGPRQSLGTRSTKVVYLGSLKPP